MGRRFGQSASAARDPVAFPWPKPREVKDYSAGALFGVSEAPIQLASGWNVPLMFGADNERMLGGPPQDMSFDARARAGNA
jgi:hypothetical protein